MKTLLKCSNCDKAETCLDAKEGDCETYQRLLAYAINHKRNCFYCGWRTGLYCEVGDFDFDVTLEQLQKSIQGLRCESFQRPKEKFVFR